MGENTGNSDCRESVRKVHIREVPYSLLFLRSSTLASLHDLNPMENKRAREPTGPMHKGQPPGMHSMLDTVREENKEGTSDAPHGR